MVASLCTWLVVSLSEHMPSNLLPEFTKATQNDIWTSRHLESLLETCVEQGRVATLANGFKIFLPVRIIHEPSLGCVEIKIYILSIFYFQIDL